MTTNNKPKSKPKSKSGTPNVKKIVRSGIDTRAKSTGGVKAKTGTFGRKYKKK